MIDPVVDVNDVNSFNGFGSWRLVAVIGQVCPKTAGLISVGIV